MNDDERRELEMAASVAVATGHSIDEHLVVCPVCGERELRAETRVEWRAVSEVCVMFGVTPAELRESGANVSALGRVKCGVPYVTCMACGLDADASRAAYP